MSFFDVAQNATAEVNRLQAQVLDLLARLTTAETERDYQQAQADEWRDRAFAAKDVLKTANDNCERLDGERAAAEARVEALSEALREAKDVFVMMSAEPLTRPQYWYVKTSYRAVDRIDAALGGSALSIEWREDSDSPGWFICDAAGPIEGSYTSKQEAQAALSARAALACPPQQRGEK